LIFAAAAAAAAKKELIELNERHKAPSRQKTVSGMQVLTIFAFFPLAGRKVLVTLCAPHIYSFPF
jgi:hypothetical protein